MIKYSNLCLYQDDFVDKNRMFIPSSLRSIIDIAPGLFESSIAPSKPEHSSKTSASNLKNELDSLMKKMKKTVRNPINQNVT